MSLSNFIEISRVDVNIYVENIKINLNVNKYFFSLNPFKNVCLNPCLNFFFNFQLIECFVGYC